MDAKRNYNIIGDIHGRTSWKELVQDECINIFVGDYFDPYDAIPHELLLQNFKDILSYKTLHPESVLLYGNHDLHYLIDCERASRFDRQYAATYRQVFAESKELFHGVAYAIGGHTLVTHAGVTKQWYEKEFGEYHGATVEEVAEDINDLWSHNKLEFSFDLTTIFDFDGESPTQSPLWIRPWSLLEHNLFIKTPFKQVFGHTQVEDITNLDEHLTCVDCLGTIAKSYEI